MNNQLKKQLLIKLTKNERKTNKQLPEQTQSLKHTQL